MALLKMCRCGKTIPISDKMCVNCQDSQKDRHKSYDRYHRDKKAAAFYHSSEWLKVREQALIRDHYLCQHCLRDKRIKQAEMVHHKLEVRDDWNLRLVLSNLISLCNACHNRVHGHAPTLNYFEMGN